MELCCFSFSSALALSFSSALQWGCCRGGSAGVGGKGEGGLTSELTSELTSGNLLFARRPSTTHPSGEGLPWDGGGQRQKHHLLVMFRRVRISAPSFPAPVPPKAVNVAKTP